MPRYRYYYEYDPKEGVWDVYEEDGGYEHGAYYDVLLFSTPTEDDAKDALKALIELAAKYLNRK